MNDNNDTEEMKEEFWEMARIASSAEIGNKELNRLIDLLFDDVSEIITPSSVPYSLCQPPSGRLLESLEPYVMIRL